MSSGGGSRVLIPNSIRKIIHDIKEITGKHSEEDIYTMLKECNMDPNETTQKLLYIDTFHEVKKKRDRRNMNMNSRVSEESSWITGTQGRRARAGRGNHPSYSSHGGGGGRNVSARKENGVINHSDKGFKPSLAVPEKKENDANSHVKNSSNISVNERVSNGSSSHEQGHHLSAGVFSSASDPVPGMCANKHVENSQNITAESACNLTANISSTDDDVANNIQAAIGNVASTKTVLEESQILENDQLLETSSQELIGPSKVIASEAATLMPEAGSDPLPELNVSVLEEASSKLDKKLEKLNISVHQHVIFPDHLQVPEDFKNGLTFGSLDANFEQSVQRNGADDMNVPTTELVQGNDEAARETPLSNLSVPSTAQDGDCPDNSHSASHVPDNSSHLDNFPSGGASKYNQLKQEILLPQGGPQYPFIQTAPNYGFPYLQPIMGSQIVQREGPEPQSVNLLVSSTSGSISISTQPEGVGQSSIAVSPPPFPVFRQPYPPNYFPFGPYLPPYYLASNAQQFLAHSGFPQQPSTSNIYLSPATAAAAGARFSVPQGKTGINAGNHTLTSANGSHSLSLDVTSSTASEDLAASENSVYTTTQQGEGPLVWLPASGREMSSLHANPFYNNLPLRQPVAFSPPQVGHGPFAGIYHPAQTMATTSTAHPLLQQSQAMAGSFETIGPAIGAYQQPGHPAINWKANP